ncbi:Ribosomal protein L13a [Giardia muris]|uniref:Ribosomal protein L13a n=1 Tax=Giardia muris TaxID=5742 RepID=A0A4Z1SSM1_GIAMU|nr:Ribosomal protein L13a [Giardia muris]|eukprot:TNJ27985.1 Ribosomal protein L13a [Giardia muris]
MIDQPECLYDPSTELVLDCRGHILGRVASVVAKELLQGRKVTLLRCEQIVLSGSFRDVKTRFLKKMNKRVNYNHKRGPFHFRAPSAIARRTIRGMIPYKTHRGMEALGRLKVFDGIPTSYANKKRLVCPLALAHLNLAHTTNRCELGRVSHEIGWQHYEDVKKFEARREDESARWSAAREDFDKRVEKAMESDAELKAINAELAKYGY